MKRHWTVLLTIVVSAFVYKILEIYMPARFNVILTIVWMGILIFLGYGFSPTQKSNNRWLGKVLISLLVIFIFTLRMNWINLPALNNVFNQVGLTGKFLDLLLIYSGWAFFQV